jgi:ADP-ribosyltransferase exoenzyme
VTAPLDLYGLAQEPPLDLYALVGGGPLERGAVAAALTPAIHLDEAQLYGLEPGNWLYGLAHFEHQACEAGEYCRNPLHPGPCKGWKHMLHSVAPGAYHAYEQQRVAKLNEARKARVKALQDAGQKVPKHLLKEITYPQVPTAPTGTSFKAPTPKEAQAALPATAKEIAEKIALKHADIAVAKAKAGTPLLPTSHKGPPANGAVTDPVLAKQIAGSSIFISKNVSGLGLSAQQKQHAPHHAMGIKLGGIAPDGTVTDDQGHVVGQQIDWHGTPTPDWVHVRTSVQGASGGYRDVAVYRGHLGNAVPGEKVPGKVSGPLAHPDVMHLSDLVKDGESPVMLAKATTAPGVTKDEVAKLPQATQNKIKAALVDAHDKAIPGSGAQSLLAHAHEKLFGEKLHEVPVPPKGAEPSAPATPKTTVPVKNLTTAIIHMLDAEDEAKAGKDPLASLTKTLHHLGQSDVTKAQFELLPPQTQQRIKDFLAQHHHEAPASVDNIAHKLGIEVEKSPTGEPIGAPAAPAMHSMLPGELPESAAPHLKTAHAVAHGTTYATDTKKLAVYGKLTAEEFHALPPATQKKIVADLKKAHDKFLDPKKKNQVLGLMDKFHTSEDVLAEKTQKPLSLHVEDLFSAPTASHVGDAIKHVDKKTYAALPAETRKAIADHLQYLHSKTKGPASKKLLEDAMEHLGISTSGLKAPEAASAGKGADEATAAAHVAAHLAVLKLVGHPVTPWLEKQIKANHAAGVAHADVIAKAAAEDWAADHIGEAIPGKHLTTAQRKAIQQKAQGEFQQMLEQGQTEPPLGGVLDTARVADKGGAPAAQKAKMLAGAAGTETTPQAAPKKTTKATGLGSGAMAKMSPALKQAIATAFKSQSTGSSIHHPPEEVYANLLAIAQRLGKPGKPLSVMQVIRSVDEMHYAKLDPGPENAHRLEDMITAWLKTPEGAAFAATAKPNPATLESLKSVVVPQGNKTPIKVPNVGGPGPYDAKLRPEDFRQYTHGAAIADQNEQMAKLGKTWTGPLIESTQTYTGSGYSAINDWLRGKIAGSPGTAPKHAATLQGGMVPLAHHTRLMRGMGYSGLPSGYQNAEDAKKLVGKVFEDPGFGSTSLSSPFPSKVLLDIEAPAGTMGLYVSQHSSVGPSEEEWLLAAGTRYKVLSVSTDAHGVTRMRVRVVSGKKK